MVLSGRGLVYLPCNQNIQFQVSAFVLKVVFIVKILFFSPFTWLKLHTVSDRGNWSIGLRGILQVPEGLARSRKVGF